MGALPRSRRHPMRDAAHARKRPNRPWLVRPTAPAPTVDEVWIAEPYPGLRGVLKEALLFEHVPASVVSPDRLRRDLDSGVLPRGLLVDAAALEADRHLLAATHVVDRLAVSTSIPWRLRNPTLVRRLRADARWLQKPFTLDDLFATVRWLAEPGGPPRTAGWRDVS